MDTIEKIVISNLKPLDEDLRDFPFHKVHGEVDASAIPDFDVGDGAPIIIDQSTLEECSGAATSEENTVFKTDMSSIVDYLNSKGQPSDLGSRAGLAAKYGITPDAQTYLKLANSGQNGDANAQLLAILRYENGDYFDFLFQYAKICQVMNDPTPYGADLRSAMQSLVAYGSINVNQSPFTFGTGKPTDRSAAQLADWRNWPSSLDAIAAKNKAGSYFAVTGSGDAFDNMISAMWLNKQNGVKAGVVFGLYYKSQWINPTGGVVVDDGTAPTVNSIGGHAMKAKGKKTISNVSFAKVQQSWGPKYGDGGIYYFPRSVINQMVAIFGSYTVSNIPKTTATYYLQNGIMLGDNWLMQGAKTLSSLINGLISRLWNKQA